MLKKVVLFIVLIGIAGASYVYFQSQQKPTDVYVATDVVVSTGDVMTGDVVTWTTALLNVTEGSLLWWKATKPGGEHTWSVMISQGSLSVESGVISWGSFDIDMSSIKLLDIQNPKLEWEIRDDFFEAITYPKAFFVITKTENQGSGLIVYGDLTIKNITKSINFPATFTTNSASSQFKAAFAIDRLLRWLTMWEGKVNNYLEFEFDLILN